MKKTLAFILVCALLVSAFTLTGFAATEVDLVGENQSGTGLTEGEFDTPSSDSQDINVTVDEVIHKYAVDLTYTIPSYQLPGFTWDVKDLVYKVSAAGNLAEKTTVVVTNYSDMPIAASTAVTDVDNNDYLAFEFTTATANIAKVDSPALGTAGLKQTAELVGGIVNTTDENAYLAVKYYTEAGEHNGAHTTLTDVKIAIITVTVSK